MSGVGCSSKMRVILIFASAIARVERPRPYRVNPSSFDDLPHSLRKAKKLSGEGLPARCFTSKNCKDDVLAIPMDYKLTAKHASIGI
ncbi:hypothetical protein NA56DRAFT_144234 [Hyaloscypha hepaticicola]|uniref:Uncharacterized protein n=1 Tax=Hyaloscypha hepaticicola TaxID=2082293 RepID=A0A2J6QN77_9HELO|nr:hypothetical protein NA56DRAFT_144234 [Hyaloscypha hepaticicola]